MVDGVGTIEPDQLVAVEVFILVQIVRGLRLPRPAPTATAHGFGEALLPAMSRIVLLPRGECRVAFKEPRPQITGFLVSDVRLVSNAEVIVKAAIAHSIEQSEIAWLRHLTLFGSDILRSGFARHCHGSGGVRIQTS